MKVSRKITRLSTRGIVFVTGLIISLVLISNNGFAAPANQHDLTQSSANSANLDLNHLQSMIKKGSTEFLHSYSFSLKIMAAYEKSCQQTDLLDFQGARILSKSAIQKLESARNQYREIVEFCRTKDLRSFFRESWLSSDYELNTNGKVPNRAESEIRTFLKEGDLMGLYQKNIDRIDDIMFLLNQVNQNLDQGIRPNVQVFWRLIQKYSEAVIYERKLQSIASKTNIKSTNTREK